LIEQGREDSRDERVRDAEGGREASKGLGSLLKRREARSEAEDPKAARESEVNGEKARHEPSRHRNEGFLSRQETTNCGEFHGVIFGIQPERNLKPR